MDLFLNSIQQATDLLLKMLVHLLTILNTSPRYIQVAFHQLPLLHVMHRLLSARVHHRTMIRCLLDRTLVETTIMFHLHTTSIPRLGAIIRLLLRRCSHSKDGTRPFQHFQIFKEATFHPTSLAITIKRQRATHVEHGIARTKTSDIKRPTSSTSC